MPKRTLAALSLIAFSFGASAAVMVTTGAGYVPMVEKLVEVCKNETAAPIEKSFGGNIGVAGVPQVMSYVLQGEVDAGFVNWQAAQKNRAKLGGVMVIEDGYEPVEMVAAVVEGAEKDEDVRKFLGCLASPKGKKVLEKAGVR